MALEKKPKKIIRPHTRPSTIGSSRSTPSAGVGSTGSSRTTPATSAGSTTIGARPNVPERKKEVKKGSGGMIIFIILILLLAAGNVYYYLTNDKAQKDLVERTEKLKTVEQAKAVLDKELADALTNLERYKGESAEKDELIAQIELQLTEKKTEIEDMLSTIKSLRYRNSQLAQAGEEVEQFREMKKYYFNAIDSLSNENNMLRSEKMSLEERLLSYEGGGETETEFIEEEEVYSGAEQLYTSPLSLKGVYSKKEKEIETDKYKKIKEFKVCFGVEEDENISGGEKEIFIRIIGPDGATIAIESAGSGTIMDVESGEEMSYTFNTYIDYPLADSPICKYWTPIVPLQKGKYKCELYCNGYLMGKRTLTLR